MFETSVPKNAEILSEFPKDVVGMFSDGKKDTLLFTEDSFEFGISKQSNLISGALTDGKSELKRQGDYLYLNIKSDEGLWTVFPFQVKDNGLDVYAFIVELLKEKLDSSMTDKEKEDKIIDEINNITRVKTILNSDSNDKEYLIDPTNKELYELMDKGYFVKIGEFKRLK